MYGYLNLKYWLIIDLLLECENVIVIFLAVAINFQVKSNRWLASAIYKTFPVPFGTCSWYTVIHFRWVGSFHTHIEYKSTQNLQGNFWSIKPRITALKREDIYETNFIPIHDFLSKKRPIYVMMMLMTMRAWFRLVYLARVNCTCTPTNKTGTRKISVQNKFTLKFFKWKNVPST